MIDIKLIRENIDLVKENIKKKHQEAKLILVDKIAKKDVDWRNQKQRIDKLRHERNSISKDISEAKKKNKDVKALMKAAKVIPDKIAEIEVKANKLRKDIDILLKKIPNIIHKSVPLGPDASKNVVREVIGKPKKSRFPLTNHAELGEELNILDFDTSAKVSGNGFYYMKGPLALLNQALISYARDFMTKKGYHYIEPPLLIRKEILEGVTD